MCEIIAIVIYCIGYFIGGIIALIYGAIITCCQGKHPESPSPQPPQTIYYTQPITYKPATLGDDIRELHEAYLEGWCQTMREYEREWKKLEEEFN